MLTKMSIGYAMPKSPSRKLVGFRIPPALYARFMAIIKRDGLKRDVAIERMIERWLLEKENGEITEWPAGRL